MIKPDYTDLDKAIMVAIETGHHTFLEIHAARVCRDESGQMRHFRMIDRRLQALRRAGKIAYTGAQGWRLMPQPAGTAATGGTG